MHGLKPLCDYKLVICCSIHFSTAITCSALNIENGMIMYSSDTTAPYDFGTTATYQCNEGYSFVRGDEVRTCGVDGSSSNGSWSGQSPACSGIQINR